MPYARDAAVFTPEGVEQLARDMPNLVAFKDGRGDVRLFQRIREHVIERLGEERLVWLAGAGDDLVAPYFAVGAEGYTSSLACFWPEASVELLRLARAGDRVELAQFHQRVVRPIYELRQRRRGYEVAVMKAAMELLGHRGRRRAAAAGQPAARPNGPSSPRSCVDWRCRRRPIAPARPRSRAVACLARANRRRHGSAAFATPRTPSATPTATAIRARRTMPSSRC